ncbi:DNA-3-methyladenine glycosylase [Clostridium niameyense]|uniref:DNA-3-methyladenine glycosylase n=1 Tax=Clostridium niameyense TaxID=1622073 RepID=UPI00067EEF96|nr:DNA-3-methyladenine glycosylase [Clostridium niameyense]
MKLTKEFYSRDAREVARELLGKVIVHKVDGVTLKGKIVETEAYIGAIDKASHAFGGKRTERLEPLYGEPGITYVYFIYGKYFCFNVITGKKEVPEGVLIRAVEPLEGIEKMSKLRFNKPLKDLTKMQKKNLTSGPSKFCMAFNIDKHNNMENLCEDKLYIEQYNDEEQFTIVEAKRVGIDYAEEAKDFLWRYYIDESSWVSLRKK